jgi:hypothetical protein
VPELRHLPHEGRYSAAGRLRGAGQRLLDRVGAVAGDDDHAARIERRHGVQYMLDQGPSRQSV